MEHAFWIGSDLSGPATMKIHPIYRRLATLVFLTAVLTGCATTAKVSRFEAFAATGAQYAATLDSLLVEVGTVMIDTDSDELLETAAEFPGAVTRAELKTQDAVLRSNLGELDLFRRQAVVLGDYFAGLSRLATTEAAESFGAELQNTVASLNGLSSALGSSSLARNEAGVAQLTQGVGTLIVRGVQLRALDRELKARKQTIVEILRLHRALLAALKAGLDSDLEYEGNRRYETEVIEPFLAGNVGDPEGWKAKRRELGSEPAVRKQLEDAAHAAQQLQGAWGMLLANKLGAADVQAVVNDLEPILAGLGKLK